MSGVWTKAWEEVLRPFLMRPKRVQVAALCYRETQGGKEVLLITSRGTGRWILPKGWPIDGKNGAESALQEAWEEAGVEAACVDTSPVGRYGYGKELNGGQVAPVETMVYLARVTNLVTNFPESDQRQRKWVSPRDAADLVQEPGLKRILQDL